MSNRLLNRISVDPDICIGVRRETVEVLSFDEAGLYGEEILDKKSDLVYHIPRFVNMF